MSTYHLSKSVFLPDAFFSPTQKKKTNPSHSCWPRTCLAPSVNINIWPFAFIHNFLLRSKNIMCRRKFNENSSEIVFSNGATVIFLYNRSVLKCSAFNLSSSWLTNAEPLIRGVAILPMVQWSDKKVFANLVWYMKFNVNFELLFSPFMNSICRRHKELYVRVWNPVPGFCFCVIKFFPEKISKSPGIWSS